MPVWSGLFWLSAGGGVYICPAVQAALLLMWQQNNPETESLFMLIREKAVLVSHQV